MRQLLDCFRTPGCLPPGTSASLVCFLAAFPAAAECPASAQPVGAPQGSPVLVPTPQEPAVVLLTTMAQCQSLACAGLGLLLHCLKVAPASCAALATPKALDAVIDLAGAGGLLLQATALSAAERLLGAVTIDLGWVHAVLDAALVALAAWTAAGAAAGHPAFPAWLAGMVIT